MRRVLALVLCTCILFSLTACGDKKVETGFVSLYSEMLSLNNVESSVDLSVSFDDVDEASLLLAKLTYLKEKGNLSDFDTVQDVYVKRASDFVGLVNGLSNSSISLKGSFIELFCPFSFASSSGRLSPSGSSFPITEKFSFPEDNAK